jgi:hypothetical protein
MLETVGSDSSSLTNGSSVESVAGKNLLPAKPCAEAVSRVTSRTANAAVIVKTAALSRWKERCDKIFSLFLQKVRTCAQSICARQSRVRDDVILHPHGAANPAN